MVTIIIGAYILGVGLFSILYPLQISTFWPVIVVGWVVGFTKGIARLFYEQTD